MSSRQRHLEKQALRRKEREKEKRTSRRLNGGVNYHPKLIVLALALVALVLIAILAPRLPPDYVTCNSDAAEAQHFHPYLFIQIGEGSDLTVKFIRVPTSMGLRSSCAWPIHVHEGSGARGSDFTMLHVESKYALSEHAYTLGDALQSWAKWLGGSYRLDANGISLPRDPLNPDAGTAFSGSTEVRTASDPAIMNDPQGPWNASYGWVSQPASPNIQLLDGVFYHVQVHCTGC